MQTPAITVPAPSPNVAGRSIIRSLCCGPPFSCLGAVFDHYAVYRATNSFTSVAGLVRYRRPCATWTPPVSLMRPRAMAPGISMRHHCLQLGQRNITTALSGRSRPMMRPICRSRFWHARRVSRVMPPLYTDYTKPMNPRASGPYGFSAATGLGDGQTADTQRWPTNGQPVTYTATVRNRGSNPWPGASCAWSWDGLVVDSQRSRAGAARWSWPPSS